MMRLTALGIFCFALPLQAIAGTADYVHLPVVEYGDIDIGLKSGTIKQTNGRRESAVAFGAGYGVTRSWMAEIYALFELGGEEGNGTRFYSFEWENTFQLTLTGKHPFELGFITELERPRERSNGYEFTFGPLFQTTIGKLQLNLNLLFERSYRGLSGGPMQAGYQFQAKYDWLPAFQFGVQGFGEMGRWNNWAAKKEQSHRFGPAVFGTLPLGGEDGVAYDAAYLLETVGERFSRTIRLQFEREF